MDSTCLLRSKSYSSPDDGQYVPSMVKIIELPRWWGALWLWHEKARTVHHLGNPMILTWEGTYCPSYAELYDFDMRRHVLSIICGALWFWHEKARTVHHQGSYMILTWDGPYCPSFGELYHVDLRRHVLSIIWGALWFWPEKARTVDHLGSSMILTWEGTYCPSSGELYDFDMRRQVRAFSCQKHRAPQMMDSTCLHRSKS
jgi:uncharacterized protein YjiS (DUF1127 family)